MQILEHKFIQLFKNPTYIVEVFEVLLLKHARQVTHIEEANRSAGDLISRRIEHTVEELAGAVGLGGGVLEIDQIGDKRKRVELEVARVARVGAERLVEAVDLGGELTVEGHLAVQDVMVVLAHL